MIIWAEEARSNITGNISDVTTTIPIVQNDYSRFLVSETAGEFFYATIRTAVNYEYIKVSPVNSTTAGLSVTRGQNGSSARAWKEGALIYASLPEAMYSELEQQSYRTYSGTPVGNITPDYVGEKLYDSTNALWYKSSGLTNSDWKFIAGSLAPIDNGIIGVRPRGKGVTRSVDNVTTAILNGDMYGWGLNSYYIFGSGILDTPTKYPLPGGWTAEWFNVGTAKCFAKLNTGDVYGWGFNYYDALSAYGDGDILNGPTIATGYNTLDDSDPVIGCVDIDVYETMCLTDSGNVWGVGLNSTGVLAQGDTDRCSTICQAKVDASTYITDVIQLSAVVETGTPPGVAALKSDGSVWVVGSSNFGELGLPSGTGSSYFTPSNLTSGVTKICMGFESCGLALKSDGTVWTSGGGPGSSYKNEYTLGRDDSTDLFAQVQGVGGSGWLENIVDIEIGSYHCVALDSSGNLYTWGAGEHGELVQGGYPVPIPPPPFFHRYPTLVGTYPTATICFANGATTGIVLGATDVMMAGVNYTGGLGIGHHATDWGERYATFQDTLAPF